MIDEQGPERFVYGTEESHGFLIGQYCRDKDGAIACMLMSQLAASLKQKGKSVHQHLDELYLKYGLHHEHQLNLRMEGSDGMRRMQRLMDGLRRSSSGRAWRYAHDWTSRIFASPAEVVQWRNFGICRPDRQSDHARFGATETSSPFVHRGPSPKSNSTCLPTCPPSESET